MFILLYLMYLFNTGENFVIKCGVIAPSTLINKLQFIIYLTFLIKNNFSPIFLAQLKPNRSQIQFTRRKQLPNVQMTYGAMPAIQWNLVICALVISQQIIQIF